jgi:hypothetical protein
MWLKHWKLLYRARRAAEERRQTYQRQVGLMANFRHLGGQNKLPPELQVLFQQFEERRLNQPVRIDNSKLYAGSNMHYYCQACGHKSQELPETHAETPKAFCSDCEHAIKRMAELVK